MKRLHVHLSVTNLSESIQFYTALFAAEPTVLKADYAKWMLEDPRVNFAVSERDQKIGLDHLGIQVESEKELDEMNQRLSLAKVPLKTQTATSCCYAESNKHWTIDPQGIAWESFHTLKTIPTFNGEQEKNELNACCSPRVNSSKQACC